MGTNFRTRLAVRVQYFGMKALKSKTSSALNVMRRESEFPQSLGRKLVVVAPSAVRALRDVIFDGSQLKQLV